MRVSSVLLQNFKRFTELRIHSIPRTAKLVLVVGPNGCGKSSLFEAFLTWYRARAGFGLNSDNNYYSKVPTSSFNWNQAVSIDLHDGEQPGKGSLYIRTAYRNDPDFSVSGLSRHSSPADELRLNRVIENDQTVQSNYHRLVYETMAGVYAQANSNKQVGQLREELIGDVRKSMMAVFGDLVLNSISDPLGDGTFYFQKGTVESYHYKNLSGGEKAAFDLLLDLHVKKRFFQNAIYCIDEIETHLHTRVQGALLREITGVVPPESQLWATTHSLGILRGAQELAAQRPDSVCIIDFEGVEPDQAHELVPSSLGRVSWEKCLSIAIDDLSNRIAPRVVVVCEGSSIGKRRRDFDAEIYTRIFGEQFPEVTFVSGGASSQIESAGVSIQDLLQRLSPKAKVFVVRDRDDLSDGEVADLRAKGVFVLPRRNLESYLLDIEVLAALHRKVHPDPYGDAVAIVTPIVESAMRQSTERRNPPDDLKSAAGDICRELRISLNLTKCGAHTDSFLRDTLAPLVSREMHCYQELADFFREFLV